MRIAGNLTFIFAILFAASVQADVQQFLDAVPDCGLSCVTSFASQFSCNASKPCICTSKSISSYLDTCVSQNCSVIDRLQIVNITHRACGEPVQSRQVHLIGTVGLGIVAFLMVNLRLYSRWTLSREWKADDWIMAAVSGCLLPFMVVGCVAARKGFGLNIWDVGTDNISTALEIYFFGEIAYVTLLGLCKISVLLFYLRIFPYTLFRLLCHITLGFIVVSTVLFQFLVLLQCLPISYNWEGWKTDLGHQNKCLDLNILGYSSAGINILQDIVILAIPVPWLWGLNCSMRKKLHIWGMFGVGIFICLCSIIRLTKLPSFKATKNPTWDFTDPTFWTAIEVYVAIIIPSLPAARSLLSHYFPTWWDNEMLLRREHPYRRSRSVVKGSSEGTVSSCWSRSHKNAEELAFEDQVMEREGDEWLELGDRTQGTVSTGIVAGRAEGKSGEVVGFSQERGIVVETSMETFVHPRGEDWLRVVEVGEGAGGNHAS